MSWRTRLGLRIAGKAAADRLKAEIIATWQAGQPIYPELNFQSLVRQGWRKNELIHACLSKTANAAAQVALRLEDAAGDPLPHHAVQGLLDHPNPYMNSFDLLRAIIITQRIAGVAYFEKEFDRAGSVIALWPLRPDWVRPVLRTGTEVAYYEYVPAGHEPVKIDPANLMVFPLWDPLGLFVTWSPVATALRVGTSDNAITDYVRLFFQNGGAPPGILKVKKRLTEPEVDRLRAQWRKRYGGFESWLEPGVLDVDADYQAIGSNNRDMDFGALDARNESRICAVLDVPPIIVGANVGLERSTFSNYAEARLSWWQDSLMPLFENLLDVFQTQLPAEQLAGARVTFDYSAVPALQELRDKRWTTGIEAAYKGLITRNEFRALVDLPADDTAGDVYMMEPRRGMLPPIEGRSVKVGAPSHNGKAAAPAELDAGETRLWFEDRLRDALATSFAAQAEAAVREAPTDALG